MIHVEYASSLLVMAATYYTLVHYTLSTVSSIITNTTVLFQMGRERSKFRCRRVATLTKDRGQLTDNIVTARRHLRAKFYSSQCSLEMCVRSIQSH